MPRRPGPQRGWLMVKEALKPPPPQKAKVRIIPNQANPCPICFVSMKEKYGPICITPCGHIFHWDCLKSWREHARTCPVCRRDLPRMSP